jgi:hypothetical protein
VAASMTVKSLLDMLNVFAAVLHLQGPHGRSQSATLLHDHLLKSPVPPVHLRQQGQEKRGGGRRSIMPALRGERVLDGGGLPDRDDFGGEMACGLELKGEHFMWRRRRRLRSRGRGGGHLGAAATLQQSWESTVAIEMHGANASNCWRWRFERAKPYTIHGRQSRFCLSKMHDIVGVSLNG